MFPTNNIEKTDDAHYIFPYVSGVIPNTLQPPTPLLKVAQDKKHLCSGMKILGSVDCQSSLYCNDKSVFKPL